MHASAMASELPIRRICVAEFYGLFLFLQKTQVKLG